MIINSKERFISPFTPAAIRAAVVFLWGVLLSGSMAYLLESKTSAFAKATWHQKTQGVVQQIVNRAERLESRLRMMAAMYQSAENNAPFNAKVFQSYVSILHTVQNFKALRALDFVVRVPRTDLKRFEALRNNEGGTPFRISTSGNADDMYIVKYIEPLTSNMAALGLDSGAHAATRENIERAIATNSASLSTQFNFVQNNNGQSAYLFTLPVFNNAESGLTPAERKQALVGLFDAVFTAEDVLQNIASTEAGLMDLQVFEGGANQALHMIFSHLTETPSNNADAQPEPFETRRAFSAEEHFTIGGRAFTLRSGSTAAFDQKYTDETAKIVAVLGLILSTTAALLVYKQQQVVLQSVFEKFPGLVAFWDTDLRCQFANEGYLDYFGRTASEMRGIKIQDLMTESLFALNESYIHGALQGKNQSFERKITKPNGEVAHTLTQYIGVMQGQNIQGFVAYITDVTQLKHNEKKALLNDVVLGTISQGIVVTDNRKLVQYVNPAFTQITGYNAEDILGASTKKLQGTNTEPAAIQALNNSIASGTPVTQKILNYRKDGSTFWNEMSISPVRNADGKIAHYVGVIRDISQSVSSEHALAQALATAQRANQSKTIFLANTSHEMRTPLHGMLGMLHLLKKTPLAPQQQEYVLATNTAAKSLLAQIDQLLDLSKLEAKKLTIHPQPMQLQTLKDDTMQWLPILTNNKPVHVSFDIDPAIGSTALLADASRLQQIITNLGSNAIRFTQHGEVRIAIEAKHSTAESCTVQFSIRDTGLGIDEANIQRIFNNFEQADASHTRLFGGTGLGLPISKQLVELMGGQLEVQSQLNVGSHFYFTLHLPLATPPSTTSASAASSNTTANEPALRNIRILVAEDNLINQKVARLLLESEGAEVTIAENGKLAVDSVAQTRPAFDVVLMDLQMPVMDGYTATQAIRQDLGLTDLPIIAMTASAMMTDRAECIKAGMNDHISKPFKIEQLTQVILEQLRLQQS